MTLHKIEALIGNASSHDCDLRSILQSTWDDPSGFERALSEHLTKMGMIRSHLGRRIDLYGDLVGRHLDRETPAIVFSNPSAGYREASFRELHDETTRLAHQWHTRGVQPGSRVAISSRADPDGIIPLLTAFRLGAVAVLLAASDAGRWSFTSRVQQAKPNFVAVADRLSEHGLQALPYKSDRGTVTKPGSTSAIYQPQDCAIEFWGQGFSPGKAVYLEAGRLLLSLTVDALMTLQLQSGWRIAGPDLEPSRHLPGLCLLALFSGATWVDCSLEKLLEHPLALNLVGVGNETRDAVLEGRLPIQGWKHWFQDPSEPLDWQLEQTFSERLAHHNAMGQNFFYSGALGGSLLYSPPRPNFSLDVLPSPGLPFVLEEPTVPGQGTESSTGVFALQQGQFQGATGRVLLSESGANFLYSGSLLDGRKATAYPKQEIEAHLQANLPAVDSAAFVFQPIQGVLNGLHIILLLFVDPARDPDPVAETLKKAATDLIVQDFGPSLRPDRVLSFPLLPRTDDNGNLDRDWCAFQFLNGGLRAKSTNPVFRLSSILRRVASRSSQDGEHV